MAQHFLLSPAAKTLSLAKVLRMTDAQAEKSFRALRWQETESAPVCPQCGGLDHYDLKTRPVWKCKACSKQFSLTSGTIFHSRKLKLRDILGAIAIFTNGAKGYSALQLSRDLGSDYKSAFVLCHKIREAIELARSEGALQGDVELDDEASHWDVLAANFPIKRVNHQVCYSAPDGTNTNMAESFFSRMRRAEIGIHHRIAGIYLQAYATEMAWREDNRRQSNGNQFAMLVNAAAVAKKSSQWCGYWQRRSS